MAPSIVPEAILTHPEERPPRQPTPYNMFIKAELSKVKHESPTLSHREAFKIASKRVLPPSFVVTLQWASCPDNPKTIGPEGEIAHKDDHLDSLEATIDGHAASALDDHI